MAESTDLLCMLAAVARLGVDDAALSKLQAVVTKAQNRPLADGSLERERWGLARELVEALKTAQELVIAVEECPDCYDSGIMDDGSEDPHDCACPRSATNLLAASLGEARSQSDRKGDLDLIPAIQAAAFEAGCRLAGELGAVAFLEQCDGAADCWLMVPDEQPENGGVDRELSWVAVRSMEGLGRLRLKSLYLDVALEMFIAQTYLDGTLVVFHLSPGVLRQ